MANEEQLAILKQGVAVWNQWRKENPNALINLSGAFLPGVDLRGANFGYTNFVPDTDLLAQRAPDLHGIDLRGADLRGAFFLRAQLWEGRFSRAKLDGARFRRAYLGGADFRGAHL